MTSEEILKMTYSDPFLEVSNHMTPDMMLVLIDMLEDWVVNDKPSITLVEACFLTHNIGVA